MEVREFGELMLILAVADYLYYAWSGGLVWLEGDGFGPVLEGN